MPTDDVATVLIVEDDVFLRAALDLMFQEGRFREAWKVISCASAEAALSVVRSRNDVDLLLTDINLEGKLTGWDLAEAARDYRPQLPVIYVSANHPDHARRVNDSRFIPKPYTFDEILAACLECCPQAST